MRAISAPSSGVELANPYGNHRRRNRGRRSDSACGASGCGESQLRSSNRATESDSGLELDMESDGFEPRLRESCPRATSRRAFIIHRNR